jgi:microcystin-dependent protein
MVTKVSRDVIDLSIRAITPQSGGIVVEGNSGSDFQISGTVIGLGTGGPADGEFVNLGATNLTITGVVAAPALVPVGGVVMFNAAFATLPANWQLCDGTNGTPDMTNQFVYGTNTEGQLLDTGGQADAIIPNHTHTTNSTGSHTHTIQSADENHRCGPRNAGTSQGICGTVGGMNPAGDHTHTVLDPVGGESVNNKNLPPYIKLAFIQRMS